MDYHSLKRRELQSLCKKHNIPANSASSVLADKLSALFNEKQKPKTQQRTCMKSSVETTDEGEPAASKRQGKTVRFSSNNDFLEYELRSGEKQKDAVTQTKARRKSVAKNVEKPAVDDSAQVPVKVTRSSVQLSGKDVNPNNIKKQSRRGAKSVEKGTDVDKEIEGGVDKVTRLKAHTLPKDDGVQLEENKRSKRLVKKDEEATETVEETVVGRVRATRSKVPTLMEGGIGRDTNHRVNKKTGKQVKTDGQSVEPDIPVRATRSTRQTQKEDIGNTVTSPQANKKRTRREMKATDLSSKSSDVAPVDKQEPQKRKSSRTRGVETVDEDKGNKTEASRVAQSKAPFSGKNSKNKAIKVETQQLEEPLKPAGKKNVNRRKSVSPSEKTEVDLRGEEPVNPPARKNTRRMSVIQKVTKTAKSPTGTQQLEEPLKPAGKKNVNRRKSVFPSERTEVDLHGEEPVNHPARKNTRRMSVMQKSTKTVESPTGIPKSRKRRGTPILEDQIIEPEYVSLADKSPKSSTRSTSKSEGKSVARKQVESSLKKPMSRMNNKSSVENASPEGKSSANRGGSLIRDSRPKKRAKLSDSEDHAVNSSKEETPVAKMSNFKLDEEVTVPDVTPAVNKSDRPFARSTIRSERKGPSQSAIKEQPIAESQLFSPEVAKFIPDPAVNTAPGRITRTGIKPGGNAAGSFSAKVSKKKQASQSAHKKQALDDAQIASSKVAEVGSEFSKEVTSQISGILSASESVRVPAKIENRGSVSGTAIDMEKASVVSGENVSGEVLEDAGACIGNSTHEASATPRSTENLPSGEQQNPSELLLSDNESPLGKDLFHIKMTSVSMADVAEIVPDAVSDVSNVQNQNDEAYVESGMFSEAVKLQTSVLKSGRPDAIEQEMELTESGSPSKGMQTDVLIEEQLVSIGKTVVAEEQTDVMIEEPTVSIGKAVVVEEQTDVLIEEPPETIGKAVIVEEQTDVVIEEPPVSIGKAVVVEEQTDVMIEEPPVSIGEAVVVEEQTDVIIGEQLVSIDESVVVEEGVDISSLGVAKENIGDTEKNSDNISYDVGSSAVFHSQVEQSSSKYMLSASGGKMSWLGPLQISFVGKHDVADDGEHYDEDDSVGAQKPLTSEPDSEDRGDVRDDGINVPKELETGSELSNANKTLEAPVPGTDIDTERVFPGTDIDTERVLEDTGDVQDGESTHDQLASNDDHATDGEDVGGDGLEPAQNENLPVVGEVLIRSCHQEPEQSLNVVLDDVPCDTVGQSDSVMSEDTPKNIATSGIDDMAVKVDYPEESVVDINKDVVSSVFGDIRMYDMNDEGGSEKEQKLTEYGEGCQPNEGGGFFSETSRVNVHALDDQEQAAATDDGLDSGKFVEEVGSHIGVNEADSKCVGDIEAHEDPIREEASPILYTNEHDMDAEGEPENEQKLTEYNEGGGFFFDIRNEQTKEEAETSRVNVHTLDDQEQAVAAEDGLDSGKFMEEDGSHIGVNEVDSKCVGDIEAHEDPIREEASPILYTNEHDMDAEGEPENEQKPTEYSEGGGFFFDMSNGQPKEEAETSRVNVHTLDDQEQAAAADDGLDSGKFMEEDGSHIGVDEVDAKCVGDIEAHQDPIREEASPILYPNEHDMDAEGEPENEQKPTEYSEGGGFFFDMSNGQPKEEAETSRVNVHTLDDQEQAAAADDGLDSGKFMEEDGSHIGVDEVDAKCVGDIEAHQDPIREEASPILYPNELAVDDIDSSQLMGDIGSHESPITKENLPIMYKKEEISVDDTDSNLPTIKGEDRNADEGTTSMDWGGYGFGMDEFGKPISANRSADMEVKGEKDIEDLDLQTSARTSSMEEISGLAAGLASSVSRLDKDSRNADDGTSYQVDMLKESANASDMTEVFNWSGAGSSLKSLFATTAAAQTSHVKGSQEDAIKLAKHDTYSSNLLSTTPATTRIRHVNSGQEAAVDFANQDSSLKTPAVTQASHVIDGQDVKSSHENAAEFANQDHCMTIFKSACVVKDGQDVKSSHEDAAEFANQDHSVAQSSHVKDGLDVKTGQEDAVDFANEHHDSSLRPAVTQPSNVKYGQEDAVSVANQDPYSSVKLLFTTSATTRMRPINDSRADAASFTIPGSRCNEDMGSPRTVAHEFNHQRENEQSTDFDGDDKRGLENRMQEVPGFEDYPLNLFEDEEVGGSNARSGNVTHFESKQFQYNETAGPSHHEPSEDILTRSQEFEKKEDTLVKGSEADNDLAFGTGEAGSTEYSNK